MIEKAVLKKITFGKSSFVENKTHSISLYYIDIVELNVALQKWLIVCFVPRRAITQCAAVMIYERCAAIAAKLALNVYLIKAPEDE